MSNRIQEAAEKASEGYIDTCCYREYPDNFIEGFKVGAKMAIAEVLKELRSDGGLTSKVCADFIESKFKVN